MAGPIAGLVIIIAIFMVVIAFKRNAETVEEERINQIPEEEKELIVIHRETFKKHIFSGIISLAFMGLISLYLYSSFSEYFTTDVLYIKVCLCVIFGGFGIALISIVLKIYHAVESNRMLQEGSYTIIKRKLIRKFYRSNDNSKSYYLVFENDRKKHYVPKQVYLSARINDEFYVVVVGKNKLFYNSEYYRLSEDDKYRLV